MLDKSKPYGTWNDAELGMGYEQDDIKYTFYGEPLPGQDVPEPEPVAVVKPPPPVNDDPGYAPTVKPKVYLTQMNLRQLRAECVDLGIKYGPRDMKKALIAKIREARK
jgi:hypothetical protein